MKVMIDTNVIIDAIQHRETFYSNAEKILLLSATNIIEAYTTAKAITDIYYLSKKCLGDNTKALDLIKNLLEIINVEDTTRADIRNALESKINDYEDAIMVETSFRIGADYIVTRNLNDYKNSKVKAISPAEFLKLFN